MPGYLLCNIENRYCLHMKNAFLIIVSVFLACGCFARRPYDPNRLEEERRAALEMQSVTDMISSRRAPPIEFEFNSAQLLQSSYKTLDLVANILKKYPRLKLIVEGHTDDVGGHEYNDLLSLKRAESVKSYLVSQGIYPEFVRTYGYGKRRPVTSDTSEKGRALNRRVEFIITNRRWEAVY